MVIIVVVSVGVVEFERIGRIRCAETDAVSEHVPIAMPMASFVQPNKSSAEWNGKRIAAEQPTSWEFRPRMPFRCSCVMFWNLYAACCWLANGANTNVSLVAANDAADVDDVDDDENDYDVDNCAVACWPQQETQCVGALAIVNERLARLCHSTMVGLSVGSEKPNTTQSSSAKAATRNETHTHASSVFLNNPIHCATSMGCCCLQLRANMNMHIEHNVCCFFVCRTLIIL